MKHALLSVWPAGLLLAAPAAAEWRCDCTTITGSCSAEVTIEDAWVDVTADSPQCARVDYFIDGRPFVSVAVEGRARQDWITRSEEPNVLIQSCQICRDNTEAGAPATRADTGAGGEDPVLEPLIRVEPAYPEAARALAPDGFVALAFEVNERGEVANATVTESEPEGVFDDAALAAIGRWRYPAEPGRSDVGLSARLSFAPPPATARSERAPTERATDGPLGRADDAARRPAGPRSQCIREDNVYNYGERVEVDLINACSEALALFACATGTGRDAGRWVCGGTGDRSQILVNSTDERVGDAGPAPAARGQREYRYADAFVLTRAPNTEYWWLACAQSDEDCRARASSWASALDRQPASVDPRARASLPVARSY